jgi:hypothetical protein
LGTKSPRACLGKPGVGRKLIQATCDSPSIPHPGGVDHIYSAPLSKETIVALTLFSV